MSPAMMQLLNTQARRLAAKRSLNGGAGFRAPTGYAPPTRVTDQPAFTRTPTRTPATSITPKRGPRRFVPIKEHVVPPETRERGTRYPREPQYSEAEIRALLQRGEMNERGERESGIEPGLEQRAREAGATAQFASDAEGAPVPGEPKQGNWGWLIALAIGYLALGG